MFFQYFWKQLFLFVFLASSENKTKIKNVSSYLCVEFNADTKTVLVFLLALIVFDFSFEGSKTHFTGEAYIYIYIYIYIFICIHWVLLGGFEAINASNQGIRCSSIFQPSCFILYFLRTWSFLCCLVFSIMTSPCYYDVTHFLTDPNEICAAYVKLDIKDTLFLIFFLFSEYLLRKLRFISKITSIVQLPYTSPPPPSA